MATAVSHINHADRDQVYELLLEVARKKTAEADVELDDRGRPVEESLEEFGEGVLIVEPGATAQLAAAAAGSGDARRAQAGDPRRAQDAAPVDPAKPDARVERGVVDDDQDAPDELEDGE